MTTVTSSIPFTTRDIGRSLTLMFGKRFTVVAVTGGTAEVVERRWWHPFRYQILERWMAWTHV